MNWFQLDSGPVRLDPQSAALQGDIIDQWVYMVHY
jgi:hypothetical protein